MFVSGNACNLRTAVFLASIFSVSTKIVPDAARFHALALDILTRGGDSLFQFKNHILPDIGSVFHSKMGDIFLNKANISF